MLPSFGMATGTTPDSNKGVNLKGPDDCHHGKHGHMMEKEWLEKMKAREQQILTWVDQYTPEKKGEWTAVIQERNTLRDKWMSPENAIKREQWKKAKMAKMEDLKKQFEEGKITKEDLMKQVHGGRDVEHWKTYHDLTEAIAKKNNQEAAQLLNQMLKQHKQHNEFMKEKMNEMMNVKPQD